MHARRKDTKLPLDLRPMPGTEIIGRDEELEWLRGGNGDRVLVGQPGAGKTALLRVLAMEGRALFVVNDDRGAIANGIRSQSPPVLMVDDAHLRIDLLDRLKHLRREIGAQFSIVASSWPGGAVAVLDALQLGVVARRDLGALTRDQIVEVVNSAGVYGPDALLRELVDQAHGKPGLASMLAYVCLQGDAWDVVLGNRLVERVRLICEQFDDKHLSAILAAFAMGGSAGMPMEIAASSLGLSPAKVHRALTDLAFAGLVSELNGEHLAVHPRVLRECLVRDVFFCGAKSLPSRTLTEKAPSLVAVIRTMIGARGRGGSMPDDLLIQQLQAANSESLWADFSWLGRAETEQTLALHPEYLITIARPALV